MPAVQITTPIDSLGAQIGQVSVQIGPRFLELFSEHLYSSPNKAFEELVSNSWDAGATVVHIGVPSDLENAAAAVWVLDNGESMDFTGLQALWAVATSNKRTLPQTSGRPQIGKFGIGKLATYALAHQLTHICRASDGIIRAVSMDYRIIDSKADDTLHIDPVPLAIRQLDASDIKALLSQYPDGEQILDIIVSGIPAPALPEDYENEYGGEPVNSFAAMGTWTLALLSDLKPTGRRMQHGWIRRLLRTSLPLGSAISILFNKEPLYSSKVDSEIAQEWVLGQDLNVPSFELPDGQIVPITETRYPHPHISISGIPGPITGRVRLYKDRISGGKSEAISASNGFLINILGRVINPLDPYFGLENLNHASWAKVRATVRADFLDDHLSVNREDLKHTPEVDLFRSFLRALFNRARISHDAIVRASWPSAGDILTESWSIVPVDPLRRVIADTVASRNGLPDFVSGPEPINVDEFLADWSRLTTEAPGSVIEDVEFRSLSPDDPLFRYELASRTIIVNTSHPFTLEHLATSEEVRLVRDSAVASLLTDAFMVDQGISPDTLRAAWEYRDQILRLIARLTRRTGGQIAFLLLEATTNARGFERIVGDALDYLGFAVHRLGESGNPEGVATAPIPAEPLPPSGEHAPTTYAFTYDAKSTSHPKVKTANINIAALARHRDDWSAQHTLVVAPDFEVAEALLKECRANAVTPMRANDLAKLVMLTATTGPLDLRQFRSVFELNNPDEVHKWIEDLSTSRTAAPRLGLGDIILVLDELGFRSPNSIHAAVIADRLTQRSAGKLQVRDKEIRDLVRGLQVLVPNLVRIASDGRIYVSTSPQKLREAILLQLAPLPDAFKFGADRMPAVASRGNAR